VEDEEPGFHLRTGGNAKDANVGWNKDTVFVSEMKSLFSLPIQLFLCACVVC
jgi:hypothetical protein